MTEEAAISKAIETEQAIAENAAVIRDAATELTPGLFLDLWPLLCKPIPEAFIQFVPKLEKGKPYASTGIKSVQVQIDRMNNVLTPLWWWDRVEYEQDGKLATVTVFVGNLSGPQSPGGALFARSSRGGVDRGSSLGNVFKGSYTNAAKVAFARIGVGHEIYIGTTDFDPDVDQDLAGESPAESQPATIGKDIAKKLVDKAWANETKKGQLQLAASRLVKSDIGDCSTKAKATAALAEALSFDQAQQLDGWLSE